MKVSREQIVDLTSLAGGAIPEAFNVELERVLANIADPNTPANKPREITIKIKLMPSSDREFVGMEAQVSSKLQPATSVFTTLVVGQIGGSMVATERVSDQLNFSFEGVNADVE